MSWPRLPFSPPPPPHVRTVTLGAGEGQLLSVRVLKQWASMVLNRGKDTESEVHVLPISLTLDSPAQTPFSCGIESCFPTFFSRQT